MFGSVDQQPVSQPSSSQAIKPEGAWRSPLIGSWTPAQMTATLIGPAAVGGLMGYVVAGNKKGGALVGGVLGIIAAQLFFQAMFSSLSRNPYMMYPG